MYVFTIAIAAMISTGILLGWHTFLILTNQVGSPAAKFYCLVCLLLCLLHGFQIYDFVQTTIEFYINIEETRTAWQEGRLFKNPFDKGWRKNLRRVFGDVPWYAALSMSFRTPPPPDHPFDLEEFLQPSHEDGSVPDSKDKDMV